VKINCTGFTRLAFHERVVERAGPVCLRLPASIRDGGVCKVCVCVCVCMCACVCACVCVCACAPSSSYNTRTPSIDFPLGVVVALLPIVPITPPSAHRLPPAITSASSRLSRRAVDSRETRFVNHRSKPRRADGQCALSAKLYFCCRRALSNAMAAALPRVYFTPGTGVSCSLRYTRVAFKIRAASRLSLKRENYFFFVPNFDAIP